MPITCRSYLPANVKFQRWVRDEGWITKAGHEIDEEGRIYALPDVLDEGAWYDAVEQFLTYRFLNDENSTPDEKEVADNEPGGDRGARPPTSRTSRKKKAGGKGNVHIYSAFPLCTCVTVPMRVIMISLAAK